MSSDDSPPEPSERSGGGKPDLTSMNLRSSVLSLALPGSMRMGLQSLITMASLMIVGSLGAEAIAAVGVGQRVIQPVTAVLQALTVGATATIARSMGAKDEATSRRVVNTAVLFAIFVGIFIAAIGVIFAPYMMRGMMILQAEPDQEVIRQGTIYLRLLSTSYVAAVALFMSNGIFQGAGDARTPLFLMTYMNGANVVVAYLLVFGVGPIPPMGIAGAGVAAAFARGSGGLIALWLLATNRSVVGMDLKTFFNVDWKLLKAIINVGFPAAIEKFIRTGSQILYTMIIAGMGTTAMAGNSIAMSIQSLSFMPGFGFGIASTALVGQNLGAEQPDRAEKSGYVALRYATVISLVMVAVLVFAPQMIAHLYTDDPEVISLTVLCLRIIAVSLPGLAMVQVFSGGLRGAGDTRFVMLSTFIGNWGFRLLGAYVLGFRMGMGLMGVWIAMAADQIGRGLIVLFRFRRGRWKHIQVYPTTTKRKPFKKRAGASDARQRARVSFSGSDTDSVRPAEVPSDGDRTD